MEEESFNYYSVRQILRGAYEITATMPILDPITATEAKRRFENVKQAARDFNENIKITLLVHKEDGSMAEVETWDSQFDQKH
jgi:hypothetical protein